MREIKFRAWFERDNAMAQVCVTINGCGFYDEVSRVVHEYVEGICSKPMQYTGLKDRNGVEIYEGDIVQVHWPKGMGVYVVKWQNKSDYHLGCWEFTSATNPNHYAGSAGNLVEVIGNIYENPELLEANE